MKLNALILTVILSLSTVANAVTTTATKVARNPADILGQVQYSSVGISGSSLPSTGTLAITGSAAEAIYLGMSGVTTGQSSEKQRSGNGIVCRLDTSQKAVCTINFVNVAKGTLEHDCSNN